MPLVAIEPRLAAVGVLDDGAVCPVVESAIHGRPGNGPRFALYVHRTDAEREWAYDRKSSVGKLDKGLDEATAKGWTIVDMKQDWKVIYRPAAR